MQITALFINLSSKEGLFANPQVSLLIWETPLNQKSLFNNKLSPKDAFKEPQLVHLMWTLNLSPKSESFSAYDNALPFLSPGLCHICIRVLTGHTWIYQDRLVKSADT